MGAASPLCHQYHDTATSTPACTQGLTEDDQPEEAEEDGRDERDSYGEEDHNSEEEEREQQRRRRHMTDIAPQFLADRQQVIEDKVHRTMGWRWSQGSCREKQPALAGSVVWRRGPGYRRAPVRRGGIKASALPNHNG